ncbi:hypothetical protein FYJ46_10915 [Enterobacteriaceae bacterium]|nr:hypothetical protein [Enterobacteriaceae bacterium]
MPSNVVNGASAGSNRLCSDSTLSACSMQIRFNDVGYFRQIFQKHTGLTPAAWKRRYSKEHINS